MTTNNITNESTNTNGELLGRISNTLLWREIEEPSETGYIHNTLGKECCICLENKPRVFKCGKCEDGIVCINCYKQNCHIKNYIFCYSAKFEPNNIMLLACKCPICRDYRSVDLTEWTREKYEFTEEEFCKKMLDFNQKNIAEHHYSYRLEEFEDDSSDDVLSSIAEEEEEEEEQEEQEEHFDWNPTYYERQTVFWNDAIDDPIEDYHSDEETRTYGGIHSSDFDVSWNPYCCEDGQYLEHYINQSLFNATEHITDETRKERELDVIANVYNLNSLFNEHYDYYDF